MILNIQIVFIKKVCYVKVIYNILYIYLLNCLYIYERLFGKYNYIYEYIYNYVSV